MIDLTVNIAGIKMKSPVILASGTCGWGIEYKGLVDFNKVGGITTKGVSLYPKEGNPPPRIAETPCGMLNSIGLENPGVDEFVKSLPEIKGLGTKVIVNIFGESKKEIFHLVEKIKDADGLELNVSCPNVEKGGMEFGRSPEITGELVRGIKSITNIPLIVKLTPNTDRILDVARAVEEAGADCLSLVNTYIGTMIDIEKRKFVLGKINGGLSGPAIKPLAIYTLIRVRKVVKIPIIGMGGITNWRDAAEFLIAGADAIGIGTVLFANPNAPEEIYDGLKKYLEENKIYSILRIINTLEVKDE